MGTSSGKGEVVWHSPESKKLCALDLEKLLSSVQEDDVTKTTKIPKGRGILKSLPNIIASVGSEEFGDISNNFD